MPPFVRCMTKHNFLWSKALTNAGQLGNEDFACVQFANTRSLILSICFSQKEVLLQIMWDFKNNWRMYWRRKFMECSIIKPALLFLIRHLVISQRQKAPNFSAFHWTPHGSLVSIGQHFVTTRVVHLQKRTETSLITKSDQIGPNHQLLQLCTSHTAWSDSDQAVRTVHSCNSRLSSNTQLIWASVSP